MPPRPSSSRSSCVHPIDISDGRTVRCGSRLKHRCSPCAELYRGDWAAIARSGVFEDPAAHYKFFLLTLTAPSFGPVHRVSSAGRPCPCGSRHDGNDSDLLGTPLDVQTYDYLGQVSWNRDSGLLWDRTRRRLRDRWDSLEYFVVREWQARGVLHVHALVRIARSECPSEAELLTSARSATATSAVDGVIVQWGAQAACDTFRVGAAGAKAIWYMAKALNYVLKDLARAGLSDRGRSWVHIARLNAAARAMRCESSCYPPDCMSRVHQRFGSRSHVASASRATARRTGWSFTALTRSRQRTLRSEWAQKMACVADERRAGESRPADESAAPTLSDTG
ncbi:replication initiator [Herbiconiux flava]|uniref:Replication initiation protein n=1 Tax=Herbiconiux flava TaxID=881268 RepID=A0A852SMX5_9MICO|nr:hypothetical protein [Herbiconiux flava]